MLCGIVFSLLSIGVFAAPPGAGASAADGCTISHGGSVVASSTIARCTGGYVGYIGRFRAKQSCSFGFFSETETGPWRIIGSGQASETAICGGLYSYNSTYERAGP